MKKKIYILIILIVILGCEKKVENKNEYLIINQTLPSPNSILNISDFIEIIDVVQLQSSDSSLVDFVNKVLIDENLIFIKGGNSVFKFDKEGHFLGKLTKKGNGPDDFVNLTDLILIPEHKRFWLYDSNQRSIFQFTYDFNFEISYVLDFPMFGLELLESGIVGTPGYMRLSDDTFSLFFFSGQNLATGFKYSMSKLPFEPEKAKYLHIYRHDYFSKTLRGDFNFVNSFNDTIYRINKNFEVNREFYVDFGKSKVLKEDLVGKEYSSIVEVFQHLNTAERSINIGNIVNLENTLIYRFFNNGKIYFSFYDKKTRNVNSGRKISFDFNEKQIIVELDDEVSFGSIGNGVGYFVLPAEFSVLGEYQSDFNVKNGDNPLIIVFHEKN